jgi:hypothetical protein
MGTNSDHTPPEGAHLVIETMLTPYPLLALVCVLKLMYCFAVTKGKTVDIRELANKSRSQACSTPYPHRESSVSTSPPGCSVGRFRQNVTVTDYGR